MSAGLNAWDTASSSMAANQITSCSCPACEPYRGPPGQHGPGVRDPEMGEAPVCGVPWDGRSMAGGRVEVQGHASHRGRQFDGVPSLTVEYYMHLTAIPRSLALALR